MTEAAEAVALEAMVDPEVVQQIRGLHAQGWGAKRIARELEVARNTVKRYLRGGDAALVQVRPEARVPDEAQRGRAVALFDEVAEGNAVVVHRELVREGAQACVRTVQRAVADRRREKRAAAVATVRYDTAPGKQMQVDFGQKKVWVGAALVTVHVLVATLSYSRRVFVTGAQLLLDLSAQDSARALERRFRHYCSPTLLCLDEIGYLSYDARNADLLFQVISRRYEHKSVVMTTNLAFSDWPTIFPNATCATALIDRTVHHADVIAIEGDSYRRRDAETDKKSRRAKKQAA